ncbi:MAG: hypothetical protein ACXAB2_02030 [Candidatus Hodarchaeales archaeon]|jgi:hypothetical protein
MKFKIILGILVLTVFSCQITTSFPNEDTFPYQLTTNDLPTGFELVFTENSTLYVLEQTWKTPSDPTGATMLTVVDYNTSSLAKSTIQLSGLFAGNPVKIEGADRTVNISFIGSTIMAQKGSYIATCAAITSSAEDVITLLEAQMAILPKSGGGIPGFTVMFSILSVGTLVLIQKKAKRFQK